MSEYLYILVCLFFTKLYLIKFLLTFPSSSVSPFSSFSSDFSSVLSLAAPAADVDAAFQLNACFAFFFGLAGFFFPFFGFSQAFCATFFCVLSSFCVQKIAKTLQKIYSKLLSLTSRQNSYLFLYIFPYNSI